MTSVSILGLGAMGARMAHRLMHAGHPVTVYNRSPDRAAPLVEAGATSAETPREAAAASGVVVAMVTDDVASRAVWTGPDGALAGLSSGAVAVESSTLTPGWVAELAGLAADRGAAFLDAPVAGSRPQAEAGALVYLVGGDAGALDRARPVLDATGVDEARAAEVLGAVPVTSPAAKGAMGSIVARQFAPLFPVDLVEKDLRYAVEAAGHVGSELPATDAVRAVFERAAASGYGGDNITGVAQLFG